MIRVALLTVILLFCHQTLAEGTIGGLKTANTTASPHANPGHLPQTGGSSPSQEPPYISAQRIKQLIAQAEHYEALNLYSLAINNLKEAQSRLHALYGVHTLAQLPVLEKMTTLYADNRQLEQADAVEALRFSLIQRHYPAESHTALESTFRLGQWQRQRGNVTDALFIFEEGLAVIDRMERQAPAANLHAARLAFSFAADEAANEMYNQWDRFSTKR